MIPLYSAIEVQQRHCERVVCNTCSTYMDDQLLQIVDEVAFQHWGQIMYDPSTTVDLVTTSYLVTIVILRSACLSISLKYALARMMYQNSRMYESIHSVILREVTDGDNFIFLVLAGARPKNVLLTSNM